jgi:hypothetical protein
MQFFLYEVVARIAAAYLCVVSYRTLRNGLAERKISSHSSDPIDMILETFMDPSILTAHRDTAPIRYWLIMSVQMFGLVGCVGVTILGWWHPTT